MQDKIFARLSQHRSRPERWAIISPTGAVMNWLDRTTYPRDAVVADLAPALARAGLALRDDDTIVRVAIPIAEVDPRRVGYSASRTGQAVVEAPSAPDPIQNGCNPC